MYDCIESKSRCLCFSASFVRAYSLRRRRRCHAALTTTHLSFDVNDLGDSINYMTRINSPFFSYFVLLLFLLLVRLVGEVIGHRWSGINKYAVMSVLAAGGCSRRYSLVALVRFLWSRCRVRIMARCRLLPLPLIE